MASGRIEGLTNMEQDAETQAIIEWLRTVDKPLTRKRKTKRTRGRAMNEVGGC